MPSPPILTIGVNDQTRSPRRGDNSGAGRMQTMIARSTEAYARVQTALLTIRMGLKCASTVDRRYRKAKLLTPKPATSVPSLEPNSIPPLPPHWILLHDELVKMQLARSGGRPRHKKLGMR
eukprot:Blabericola_migrator_1__230@NODE_1060_length_5561_cov_32_202767_g104_i4_p8_GENE_NODE_1060_length_5561_cov_32_202767_g104_i4NODE_1060_length_5561_cov_32_202767_g104_i4_p8_ORF_typecomplete_len121_score9_57_NODE_1060_length_5561_cov_32_202767_g104_i437394101